MKLLGEGAFARVELCRLKDSALQRLTDPAGGTGTLPRAQGQALLRNKGRVAVKCMKRFIEQETASGAIRQVPTPQQWLADFDAEALLLQSLKSPNVVACYGRVLPRDPKNPKSEIMFLQEYCAGGTLLRKV